MNKQKKIRQADFNKEEYIKIKCDLCGKVRKCYIIKPQNYKDIYGVRCNGCMEELE